MRRGPVRAVLQPWWRLTRGLTLGVRAFVRNEAGDVLLVRHGYVSGWHLPGGGVERGETLRSALVRELREETGVAVEGPVRLHGVFSNDAIFPGDHVAVFLVEAWRQADAFRPNAEVVATAFHSPGDLPAGTSPATRRRIREILDGAPADDAW